MSDKTPDLTGVVERVEMIADFMAKHNVTLVGHYSTDEPGMVTGVTADEDVKALRALLADYKARGELADALTEALTPSGDTKHAYIGEFSFPVYDGQDDAGDEVWSQTNVPWDTVKEIMAAILRRARTSISPNMKEGG